MLSFRYISKIMFALMGIAMVATACGGEDVNYASQSDLDRVEGKVDQLLMEQEDEASPTTRSTLPKPDAAPPATVKPPVVIPVITDSNPEASWVSTCEDYRDNLDAKVAELSLPPGVFFYGACTEDSMWFMAYQGTPSDVWYADWNRAFRGPDETGYEGPLTDWPEIPGDARHPAFPQAATLNEIAALPEGSVVCKHFGATTQQLFIVGTYAKAYFYKTMTRASGAPYLTIYEAPTDRSYGMPATDWGISPYEDGVWSVAYMSIGPCA